MPALVVSVKNRSPLATAKLPGAVPRLPCRPTTFAIAPLTGATRSIWSPEEAGSGAEKESAPLKLVRFRRRGLVDEVTGAAKSASFFVAPEEPSLDQSCLPLLGLSVTK